MAKFRKKPVVIEAWQIAPDDGQTRQLPPSWLMNALSSGECVLIAGGGLEVRTLEDGADGRAKHVADVGDWIIQGVKGELYPCKPDIFDATYEPA
jgi:hypothetical protein